MPVAAGMPGYEFCRRPRLPSWIPAFAGMTHLVGGATGTCFRTKTGRVVAPCLPAAPPLLGTSPGVTFFSLENRPSTLGRYALRLQLAHPYGPKRNGGYLSVVSMKA